MYFSLNSVLSDSTICLVQMNWKIAQSPQFSALMPNTCLTYYGKCCEIIILWRIKQYQTMLDKETLITHKYISELEDTIASMASTIGLVRAV